MYAEKTKIVKLYSYNDKGIYTGSFEYNWLVGTGLASNSTLLVPPQSSGNKVAVFNGTSWSVQENHMNKVIYSVSNKTSKIVDYVGNIEAGYTLLAPKTPYDTWNGGAWQDTRTKEEKEQHYLESLPPLTRRQFKLALVHNDLNLDDIRSKIEEIEDVKERQLTIIEWDEANEFRRTSETLNRVAQLLALDKNRINAMWEQALTY